MINMIYENKNYVELAKKFIDQHNSNNNWSPFDRLERMAVIMYANWLDSLEKVCPLTCGSCGDRHWPDEACPIINKDI